MHVTQYFFTKKLVEEFSITTQFRAQKPTLALRNLLSNATLIFIAGQLFDEKTLGLFRQA